MDYFNSISGAIKRPDMGNVINFIYHFNSISGAIKRLKTYQSDIFNNISIP